MNTIGTAVEEGTEAGPVWILNTTTIITRMESVTANETDAEAGRMETKTINQTKQIPAITGSTEIDRVVVPIKRPRHTPLKDMQLNLCCVNFCGRRNWSNRQKRSSRQTLVVRKMH